MNIAAITRYKHGRLYEVLKRLGWTQTELAKQSGMSKEKVGTIINLVRRPNPEEANAIQRALGNAGEYLDVLSEWPESFVGLKRGFKREQTADIQMESLLDHPEVLQLPAPQVDDNLEAQIEGMEEALETLPDKERKVLLERFYNDKTLEETGKELGGTNRERIRQIENNALRKMRHPKRIRKIRPYTPGDEIIT